MSTLKTAAQRTEKWVPGEWLLWDNDTIHGISTSEIRLLWKTYWRKSHQESTA